MQRATAPLRAMRALRTLAQSQRRGLARMSLIGRLGQTPESVPTSSGRDVIRYAVATNYGPPDNRQTSWFNVASFVDGAQKDYLLNLPKGALIHVEADTRMTQYEKDGERRSGLSLTQRSIEVLSYPKTQADGEQTQQEAEAMGASA